MGQLVKIWSTCDCCTAQFNERTVDVADLSKPQPEKKVRFSISFDGELHSYKDVCPACEKTFARCMEDTAKRDKSRVMRRSKDGDSDGDDPKSESQPKDKKANGKDKKANGKDKKAAPAPKAPAASGAIKEAPQPPTAPQPPQ